MNRLLAILLLVAVAGAILFAVERHSRVIQPVAATSVISGPARVIDADTVVVGKTHVRLKGVDGPELGNPIGQKARQTMIAIIGNSELHCRLTGEKAYNREVGYCITAQGVDINQAIVAAGAALACPRYDGGYLAYEQAAALAVQRRAPYCIVRRRGAAGRDSPIASPTSVSLTGPGVMMRACGRQLG
jgi:endonuclease YncB( thermonuclease family)